MMRVYRIFLFFFIWLLFYSCQSTQPDLIFISDNIAGLKKQDEIQLKGLKIGEITNISISKKGQIIVLGELHSELKIPKDSYFEIENMDILGAKYIELHLGESKQEYEKKDTFSLALAHSGDNILAPMLEELINNLNPFSHLDSLNAEIEELNETLKTLDTLGLN